MELKSSPTILKCNDRLEGIEESVPSKNYFDDSKNVFMDMRIVKLEFKDQSIVDLNLIFKLDYLPLNDPLLYTFYLVSDFTISDIQNAIKKDVFCEVSIDFISRIYKTKSIKLFKFAKEKLQQEKGHLHDGSNYVTLIEARNQVKLVLQAYYGE